MNTQRNGLTTEQALDQLERLYDDAVEALRNAIRTFTASGTLPDAGLRRAVCLSGAAHHRQGEGPQQNRTRAGDVLPTPAATARPSRARRCCVTISANSCR